MLSNNKGISLVETLVAFGAWSIIVSLLLPHLVLLTQEKLNTIQSTKAYKILHEKTQQISFKETLISNEKFIQDDMEYVLTWEEENEYTKACLAWTNTYKKKQTTCFLVE